MGVRLDSDELWDFLETGHTGIFTSLKRDGFPVALPIWYSVVDRKIYFRTPAKTKKIMRIQADDRCSFLVESGLQWKELKAVHLTGRAVILEPGDEVDRAAAAMSGKYEGFRSESTAMPDATKKHYSGFRWVRVDPVGDPISWDNAKIRMKADA